MMIIEWRRLRSGYQKKMGNSFDPVRFHDRAPAEGPIPMKALYPLMMNKAAAR
ncbi:MAG: hypothetical protein AB2L14_04415 [Candidatus Xenobiia bacterium LiM19]